MFYDVFGPRTLSNDFDRLFDRMSSLMARGSERNVGSENPLNVWANDDSVAITTEVPGVEAANLQLSIIGNTVAIVGKRDLPEVMDATWHRQERGNFDFNRTIHLPYQVDPDKAEARIKDGVLTLLMRRVEADKPRAISVAAA